MINAPQPANQAAIAEWLYNHYDTRTTQWPWSELSQQTKDQYGAQAEVLLAFLSSLGR